MLSRLWLLYESVSNNLIKSYLENRRQYVDLNEVHSELLTNGHTFSLPQGSNLDPFLFLVYINDIFSLKLNGKLILFADDASILKVKLREDLHTIQISTNGSYTID